MASRDSLQFSDALGVEPDDGAGAPAPAAPLDRWGQLAPPKRRRAGG